MKFDSQKSNNSEMIWGYLLHLGYNMWSERDALSMGKYVKESKVAAGINTIFNDQGGVFQNDLTLLNTPPW